MCNYVVFWDVNHLQLPRKISIFKAVLQGRKEKLCQIMMVSFTFSLHIECCL